MAEDRGGRSRWAAAARSWGGSEGKAPAERDSTSQEDVVAEDDFDGVEGVDEDDEDEELVVDDEEDEVVELDEESDLLSDDEVAGEDLSAVTLAERESLR